MKAITYHEYGGPEVLGLSDIDPPVPGPGELLLDVKAAAVNPYDVHFMHGMPLFMRLIIGLRRPRSTRLGRDVSGVVAAVGPEVYGFQVGDEVYGGAHGAFAEQAVAKAREIVHKPAALSWVEAAAVPMAAFTALQGLRAGGCGPGKQVMINGASGGIGHYAVQIAKAQGAHVTAVCKRDNLGWVGSLGADEMVDYEMRSATDTGPYDVVVDTVANHSIKAFGGTLSPGGTYVWLGSASMGRVLGPIGRILRMRLARPTDHRLISVDAKRTREDMEELNALIEEGRLRSVVEHVFPLAETAAAIAHVATGHTKGKTVVQVA